MALKSGRVGIHPSQVDPITGMLLNGPTTTLSALQDVQITDPEDGDYLTYDSANSKWINSGEAPAPTYTDLTVTMYGAVEDTISFTDAAGISHSEVFASGQSSKSVIFKINPSGSTSITFTSAVAKDPDNLTADYSKTVIITDATTEIKVMPDNALYWYGYEKETFAVTNYRPSYMGGTQGTPTVTRNKNDFYFTNIGYQGSIIWNDVALGSASSLKVIGNTSKGSTADTHFNVATTANISGNGYAVEMSIDTVLPSSKGLVTVDVSGISNNRGVALAVANCYGNCYALWYE